MLKAIYLSKKAVFFSSPNPSVGCYIKKNILGYTKFKGYNHAEINALKNIKNNKKINIYLTLEPCNYLGLTNSCLEYLININIYKIFICKLDNNKNIYNNSIKILKLKNIKINLGLLNKIYKKINKGYFYKVKNKKPLIRLKIASSIDNKICLKNKKSKWITNKISRINNQLWRIKSCAIITGIGTILKDNSFINIRNFKKIKDIKNILIDTKLKISLNSNYLKNNYIIIFTNSKNKKKIRKLKKLGIKIFKIKLNNKKLNFKRIIEKISFLKINEIQFESGFSINNTLISLNKINEILIYLSPIILGKSNNIFNFKIIKKIIYSIKYNFESIKYFNKDLRILLKKI
ncbi:riboflavin biosynthesis protein RibD [Candidatus Zinderia insecticola CARI]|uniref:Riboflavin biosynthesis protein RibD n=1 Tax=Zinderia insecticola (strain CARI) TaxID=871271 RepID=E0TIL5_ZINIC|nr:riboflavin biosynthesis protein RibD [Candidatus Zinderia insecticola CARI]